LKIGFNENTHAASEKDHFFDETKQFLTGYSESKDDEFNDDARQIISGRR